MSQLVACPECTKHLQVPDNLMGKKVQCPECKNNFVAKTGDEDDRPSTGLTSANAPSKSSAAWDKKKPNDDDEEDDRKSKRKKRARDDDDDDDDDEYDRPRRRSRSSSRGRRDYVPHRGGMILAFGLIGLLVLPIFGIIAWVMGNSDLAEMKAGRMDPEGESMTNTGKILGMVAVILWSISLVAVCGFFVIWFLFVAMIFGAAAGAQQQNMQNIQQRQKGF